MLSPAAVNDNAPTYATRHCACSKWRAVLASGSGLADCAPRSAAERGQPSVVQLAGAEGQSSIFHHMERADEGGHLDESKRAGANGRPWYACVCSSASDEWQTGCVDAGEGGWASLGLDRARARGSHYLKTPQSAGKNVHHWGEFTRARATERNRLNTLTWARMEVVPRRARPASERPGVGACECWIGHGDIGVAAVSSPAKKTQPAGGTRETVASKGGGRRGYRRGAARATR